jgi:hypothetical protein
MVEPDSTGLRIRQMERLWRGYPSDKSSGLSHGVLWTAQNLSDSASQEL